MEILIGLFGLPTAWLLWSYSRLLKARDLTQESWRLMEIQLKRRHDLVPALVECLNGHHGQERPLLEALANERRLARDASGLAAVGEAERFLGRNLGRMVGLVERYPGLKTNSSFCDLAAKLVAIEDQIEFSQRSYNRLARILNETIGAFPGNLIANLCFFIRAEIFEVETASARLPPTVVEALRARFLILDDR
jgi:LemA protein